MKLSLDQQWRLIDRFIETKRKQGAKQFVKQSLPSLGVWIDGQFFDIKILVETLNKLTATKYEV